MQSKTKQISNKDIGAKGIDLNVVDFSVWTRRIDLNLTLDVVVMDNKDGMYTVYCPALGSIGFTGASEVDAITQLKEDAVRKSAAMSEIPSYFKNHPAR